MEDLEFIQKCVQGDKRLWDEFVDRYSRLIYNYINCILRQKNPHLATQENISDIFQEIFLALSRDNFKKLKSFKGRNGCSLASWLRQVTINFTLDYVRKFRPTVSLDEEAEEGLSVKDLIADTSAAVRDDLNLEEKIMHLKECIGRLDTDDKYFIEFHIARGLSLENMKDIFKVSRGAIDMRKSRIVERLRDCFKSRGFGLDL